MCVLCVLLCVVSIFGFVGSVGSIVSLLLFPFRRNNKNIYFVGLLVHALVRFWVYKSFFIQIVQQDGVIHQEDFVVEKAISMRIQSGVDLVILGVSESFVKLFYIEETRISCVL